MISRITLPWLEVKRKSLCVWVHNSRFSSVYPGIVVHFIISNVFGVAKTDILGKYLLGNIVLYQECMKVLKAECVSLHTFIQVKDLKKLGFLNITFPKVIFNTFFRDLSF
jgi:hypothetical protein